METILKFLMNIFFTEYANKTIKEVLLLAPFMKLRGSRVLGWLAKRVAYIYMYKCTCSVYNQNIMSCSLLFTTISERLDL